MDMYRQSCSIMVEIIDFRIECRFVSQIYHLLMTLGKQIYSESHLINWKMRTIIFSNKTIERITKNRIYKIKLKYLTYPLNNNYIMFILFIFIISIYFIYYMYKLCFYVHILCIHTNIYIICITYKCVCLWRYTHRNRAKRNYNTVLIMIISRWWNFEWLLFVSLYFLFLLYAFLHFPKILQRMCLLLQLGKKLLIKIYSKKFVG